MTARTRWLGAVEGYYGTPLTHADRLDLVRWLATRGYNAYAYAPKNDPLHRDRWREPYGPEQTEQFRELIATGHEVGVRISLGLSPGLDFQGEADHGPLIDKLTAFREMGCDLLAVAYDDVPPGGAELGAAHGGAVAAAVDALGAGVDWITCPTDYATAAVTPYLAAFAGAMPEHVDVMWTGPSVVSPRVGGADAATIAAGLGRPPLFAENFPVNDGGMEGVLHLGPYPERAPDLVAQTSGVFCNFMTRARASRVGLAVAARFWTEPDGDRWATWREVLDADFPEVAHLARASCSWLDHPGTDPELEEWFAAAVADPAATRFVGYLHGRVRTEMDPVLAAELEPWIDAWERHSHAMQVALALLAVRPRRPADLAFAVAALWDRTRQGREEVFGVRWAAYPLTEWDGAGVVALPEGILRGQSLTDRLCSLALTGSQHPAAGPED